MGRHILSSRCGCGCGCRCECGCAATTTTAHDVIRSYNDETSPDAVLEGLAMAGLVAILRQLGDLAELGAEVFEELQEQVTVASARGRRLAVRAKQLLEVEDHLSSSSAAAAPAPAPTPGTSSCSTTAAGRRLMLCWRAHLEVPVAAGGGGGIMIMRPRLVVHHIKSCRGPPRLSLLDRFHADGEGACLKKYTDPSFFRRMRGHHSSIISASGSSAKLQQRRTRTEPTPKFQSADDDNSDESASAHTDDDNSEKQMLRRQLKYPRHTAGAGNARSVFQMLQDVHKVESSAERRDLSCSGHSRIRIDDDDEEEEDISFTNNTTPTSQTQLNMEAKEKLHAAGATAQPRDRVDRSGPSPPTPPSPNYYCSGAAGFGSDLKFYRGCCSEPPSPPPPLERTSSFEAWLSPDAHAPRFTTAHRHHEYEITTQEPPPEADADGTTAATCSNGFVSHVGTVVTTNSDGALSLSSTTTMKAKQSSANAEMPCNSCSGGASKKKRSRYKGSVEMIASRVVSSLPRKLFMHSRGSSAKQSGHAAGSLRLSSQSTRIGDCNSEAIPIPRKTFLPLLLHSDPVSSIHNNLLPENDGENYYLQHHESTRLQIDAAETHHQQEDPSTNQCGNSSSTPETCGDATCTPDSKNLLLPGMQRTGGMNMINGSLHTNTKRAGVSPENSCSEYTKVDTPPLPPIPPIQWLSEKVHTGPGAASPKHRALWKKSLEVDHADTRSNEALHSVVRTQVAETIQARTRVDTEQTLVLNENANANVSHTHTDEMECSEEISHRKPFRKYDDVQASEGINILKAAGEFPETAALSDEARSEMNLWKQAQADTRFQQEGRQQFDLGSEYSDHQYPTEKLSEGHEVSDSSSNPNLQNESVFFSAVQQLAKMSRPPPSVPRSKYSLPDVGTHGRITLRNGPSLIHPSRNILDSRSVLLEQIKDNKSFILKPTSGASSPVPLAGSPTNSKVATILQRADDIRQAHADRNHGDSEDSWSEDSH